MGDQSLLKLARNYELFVQTSTGDTLIITPPFTLELDITRNTLSSANICQIRLYNLSAVHRNQIYFNIFDQSDFRQIILKAGYGETNLSTIFTGNISQAWSYREHVDFITQIECYDGGFAYVNGKVNITFPAKTPLITVIRTLMGFLPQTEIGAIGAFSGVLSRSNTYSGNAAQILTELTGGAFFIDNGKAYALQTTDYLAAVGTPTQSLPVIFVNDQTGLLNTPIREQSMYRFEMLFEPTLNVGGLVQVDSFTNPFVDGTYKITAVKHRGIISPVVSGDLITSGEFFFSRELTPAFG